MKRSFLRIFTLFALFTLTGAGAQYTRHNPVQVSDLAAGTDGELFTWDASGDPDVVAVGTVGQFLTSGGAGVAPTFQGTPWGDYAATWVSLTVGNGTVVSRYVQIGNLVTVLVNLTWGSTTSISGDVTISLPVTASSAYSGETPIGTLHALDAGTLRYFGVVTLASTTTASMRIGQSDATYLVATALSSTIPFTWTTSDQLNLVFSYEAN